MTRAFFTTCGVLAILSATWAWLVYRASHAPSAVAITVGDAIHDFGSVGRGRHDSS